MLLYCVAAVSVLCMRRIACQAAVVCTATACTATCRLLLCMLLAVAVAFG
jgi:hypothetical protein